MKVDGIHLSVPTNGHESSVFDSLGQYAWNIECKLYIGKTALYWNASDKYPDTRKFLRKHAILK